MPHTPHDQFGKDLLGALLPLALGGTASPRVIAPDPLEVDLVALPGPEPNPLRSLLGLLGDLIEAETWFEPFRRGLTFEDIVASKAKLLLERSRAVRQAERQGQRLLERDLPTLWIITPTISSRVRTRAAAFRIVSDPTGVWRLQGGDRCGVIAIHSLATTPDTLWLRLLGRGRVQQRAFQELAALDSKHPFRTCTLGALDRYRRRLAMRPSLSPEELELIRAADTSFEEYRAALIAVGVERGIEKGFSPLEHQFIRRLGRALSANERSTLLARLDSLGPNRLGDVVLDLDPESLASWLNDSAAL